MVNNIVLEIKHCSCLLALLAIFCSPSLTLPRPLGRLPYCRHLARPQPLLLRLPIRLCRLVLRCKVAQTLPLAVHSDACEPRLPAPAGKLAEVHTLVHRGFTSFSPPRLVRCCPHRQNLARILPHLLARRKSCFLVAERAQMSLARGLKRSAGIRGGGTDSTA